MEGTFLMRTTSSITMQSLGKIVLRRTAVGAKMWCLLPAGCREAANCRYCQKSGYLPRRGDSLHRFTSNLAAPTGTSVRLAAQNFTCIATGGWECVGSKKMNDSFFDEHDELYHHAKFGEDRTMRAGCRCENV